MVTADVTAGPAEQPEVAESTVAPLALLAAADVVELLAAWKVVNLAQDQIDELEAEFADGR